MKRIWVMLMVCLFVSVSAHAEIIGYEPFDYSDGPIEGLTGGIGWDWDNLAKVHTPTVSDWDYLWGNANVQGQALVTDGGGAYRQYNGPGEGSAENPETDERLGAFRGESTVYYGVTFTLLGSGGWAGFSGYDFGSERIFIGMPGGQPNFGIDETGVGQSNTDIPVVVGETCRLVAAIDFDGDQLRLWVNPDAGDYDNGALDNSADVTRDYTGTNWNTAIRCASGSPAQWDDVMVATDFSDVLGFSIIRAQNPSPADGAQDVKLNDVVLVWDAGQDPNNLTQINEGIIDYDLYMTTGSESDPNLYYIDTVDAGSPVLETVQYPLGFDLEYDGSYQWRIDENYIDPNGDAVAIEGFVWTFDAEKSVPIITHQTAYQTVEAGDAAIFSVDVKSISQATYQWYKVEGLDAVMLDEADSDISGSTDWRLVIDNVEIADEGAYFCVVSNDSGVEVESNRALLGVRRMLAYWPFDNGDINSIVEGDPDCLVHGDPAAAEGIVGGAMYFDGEDDAVYMTIDSGSYFDICDHEITVTAWVKTNVNNGWDAFVSRRGEGQGWQLRQHGGTSDRACFTTRGTGNEDGSYSDVSITDGQWHLLVGTFDGQKKKLYVDGIVNQIDDVTGPINNSEVPVVVGGRAWGTMDDYGIDGFGNATLDDVRVYNYAIDADAVAQLYADGTGESVCPYYSEADLNRDCRVDLIDLARMAAQWLTDNTVTPQ